MHAVTLMTMPRSSSRDSRSTAGPTRGRSPGRSHSRRPRYRSRLRFKKKECNFVAAICSMIVIVTLAASLAEPNWLSLRGGGCRNRVEKVHSIGVLHFFYIGYFETAQHSGSGMPLTVYHYGPSSSSVLVDCVTAKVAHLMRAIIALCFVSVMLSFTAFLLDLSGPSTRTLKFLRRNAVFNLLTVILCVTINGFCFTAVQLIDTLQKKTKTHVGSKVEVTFDVSFYLVAASGAMSVVAAACNLLRRYPPPDLEHRDNLLDDYDGVEGQVSMRPPPAYTP